VQPIARRHVGLGAKERAGAVPQAHQLDGGEALVVLANEQVDVAVRPAVSRAVEPNRYGDRAPSARMASASARSRARASCFLIPDRSAPSPVFRCP
jgi:hypothetical protein